jgi:hypothetical protein
MKRWYGNATRLHTPGTDCRCVECRIAHARSLGIRVEVGTGADEAPRGRLAQSGGWVSLWRVGEGDERAERRG